MGYHHCPIEPPDWSDGPDYAEGDCPDCDGTGSSVAPRRPESGLGVRPGAAVPALLPGFSRFRGLSTMRFFLKRY